MRKDINSNFRYKISKNFGQKLLLNILLFKRCLLITQSFFFFDTITQSFDQVYLYNLSMMKLQHLLYVTIKVCRSFYQMCLTHMIPICLKISIYNINIILHIILIRSYNWGVSYVELWRIKASVQHLYSLFVT
jgi:hypothetical protein